jgi:hypothetical protein
MNESEWKRLSLNEIQLLLEKSERPWWIAGGIAIDLFLGYESRPHTDLDIVIDHVSHQYFRIFLSTWDMRATDPPGSLKPMAHGDVLSNSVNAIWCRQSNEHAWQFEFLLAPFTETEWIYRRNPKIRGPIKSFGWKNEDGLQIIAPEIQLLYKAKARREKDEADFQNCLPHLNKIQILWLKEAIEIDFGENHPWLELLIRAQN